MSGFVERLRAERARAEEQSRRADLRRAELQRIEEERLRLIRAEDDRREALRRHALENSVVPEIARNLAGVINKPIWGNQIILDTKTRSVGWREHETTEKVIVFGGMEDGRVRVGHTILSAKDAQDPEKVDRAFEKAYKSPATKMTRSEDGPLLDNPFYPGGPS